MQYRIIILHLFISCFYSLEILAQNTVKSSPSYDHFGYIEFYLDDKKNTGLTDIKKFGQEESAIRLTSTYYSSTGERNNVPFAGNIRVQVFTNPINTTPENPGVLLLEFSTDHPDYKVPENLVSIGLIGGKVNSNQGTIPLRGRRGNFQQNVLKKEQTKGTALVERYKEATAEARSNSLGSKSISKGIPVRITLTFERGATIDDFGNVKVPHVPALRLKTSSDKLPWMVPYIEGDYLASWFGKEYFTSNIKVKFIGLKRQNISVLDLNCAVLRDLKSQLYRHYSVNSDTELSKAVELAKTHLKTEDALLKQALQNGGTGKQIKSAEKPVKKGLNMYNEYLRYIKNIEPFGTSDIKITRKLAPMTSDEFKEYIKTVKTPINVDVKKICSRLVYLIETENTDNQITEQTVTKIIKRLSGSPNYTAAAKNSSEYTSFCRTLIAALAINNTYNSLNKAKILLPLIGKDSKGLTTSSIPKLFKVKFLAASQIFMVATNKGVIAKNLKLMGIPDEYKGKIFVESDGSIPFSSGSSASPPIFQGQSQNQSVLYYNLYSLIFSKTDDISEAKWNQIKNDIYAVFTVTDEGPFPISYNFDPSPIINEKMKPLFDGPTLAKPHLVGSHRGNYRTPGVPENSPWAWEKAIYEAAINGTSLDVIEIDAIAKTLENTIVITHEPWPNQCVYFDPATTKPINQFPYKELKKHRLKDYFGKPVEGTYMLTLKAGLEYFKCRQQKGACDCLIEIGYLPKDYATNSNQEGYADKQWVLQNSAGIKIPLALDKLVKDREPETTPRFLNAYESALETGMEDYVFFVGKIDPHQFENGAQEIDEYRRSVLSQVFYFPVFYWDSKGNIINSVNVYSQNSNRLDHHNRWHIPGYQPQIGYPPPTAPISQQDKGEKLLKEVVQIAQKQNKWIVIYGGLPQSPFGQPLKNDIRTTPEFQWLEGNNLWITDTPIAINKFLKTIKKESVTARLEENKATLSSLKIPSGTLGWSTLTDQNTNSYSFSRYKLGSEAPFILPVNRVSTPHISTIKIVVPINSSTPTYKELANKTGSSMKYLDFTNSVSYLQMENFLGYKSALPNFTISMWVKYESSQTFEIFNALDESSKVLFGLKSINNQLVLIRNTGSLTPKNNASITDISYNQILDQGCKFDAGPGWYYIVVTVSPTTCRVGIGKPKAVDYISDSYGALYDQGDKKPIPRSPGKNKDMSVVFMQCGSLLQDLEKTRYTTFLKNDGTIGLTGLADFRIGNVTIGLDEMYKLFNAEKVKYRVTTP